MESYWGERMTDERKKEVFEEFEENRRRQLCIERMKKAGLYFFLSCNLLCVLISLFK